METSLGHKNMTLCYAEWLPSIGYTSISVMARPYTLTAWETPADRVLQCLPSDVWEHKACLMVYQSNSVSHPYLKVLNDTKETEFFMKTMTNSLGFFLSQQSSLLYSLSGQRADTFSGLTQYSRTKFHEKQWPFYTSESCFFWCKAFLFICLSLMDMYSKTYMLVTLIIARQRGTWGYTVGAMV